MKLNINANIIKSPLQSEFVIADRIQLETDSLSIMLNAVDINVPIDNINTGTYGRFSYEGRQKEGNWMSYWVNVKAKDLIELYPHVHAHQAGAVSNQTPYDFQLTIGHGIEAHKLFERDTNQPESRYIEVHGVEAGNDELAVRQVLSALAGQLLTSHRANAHLVNMVSVHIAEQLIQLGMTHFKQGDIKFNGFLKTHSGLVQTERLWRLGNPGTSKLSLRQTLLTQQTGPNSRTTHLINLDDHHVYSIDGKYQQPNGGNGSGMMYTNSFMPYQQSPMMMQPQGYPTQPFGPGIPPQQQMGVNNNGSMNNMNYQQMQVQPQLGEGLRKKLPGMAELNVLLGRTQAGTGFPESMDGLHQHVKDYPNGFFSATSEDQITEMNNALYNGMGLSAGKVDQQVPAINNRSLVESDLGPRNEDTPIRGKVKYIEVAPVLITEDSASIVNDGSHNAYGVYRREDLDGNNLAVHIGDFLDGELAVGYAIRMGKFFNVDVEDYVSPAPADANK